ncbi:MAG: Ig-like domain-containing protein, partial [Bacteroidia bacterium]|nr:Ig-like domain-containing protein [Bacteroidia bacterium]
MSSFFTLHSLSFLLFILSVFTQSGYSQSITSVGTDFWIAFQPNWNNNPPELRISISSNYSTTGSVYSEFPGVNQDFTVVTGVITEVFVPSGVRQFAGIESKGIRITSEDPISVYGLNRIGASTDAYLALPVNALGTDYRVVSYNASGVGSPSRFSVVATEDNTVVTMYNAWTNETSVASLNQGETYLSNDNSVVNQDITGSRIESNHPVAVYGSNDCVYVPDPSCQACEHIVEQMFPYFTWGKNFVTVPTAGRDNSGDVFRIMAADDGTAIWINGLNVSTLNAGDYYQTNLTGYNSITTSNPAMVAQFAKGIGCTGGITGDPFMMLIPPREQFLTNYTVTNLSGFYQSWVNVVAPDYALGTIYQDGILIPNSAFTQIPFTTYYGAQREVTWGSHTFTSENSFGVFVYGWQNADSYGYPGGCSFSQIVNVNTIILTPDTSYGQLNVTNVCLTATVTDSLSNPLEGILVTFNVSGVAPLTGNAYTDSLGNAHYCYTQTGSTPGTDQVYAEVSDITSNTVVVIWSIDPPCIN